MSQASFVSALALEEESSVEPEKTAEPGPVTRQPHVMACYQNYLAQYQVGPFIHDVHHDVHISLKKNAEAIQSTMACLLGDCQYLYFVYICLYIVHFARCLIGPSSNPQTKGPLNLLCTVP